MNMDRMMESVEEMLVGRICWIKGRMRMSCSDCGFNELGWTRVVGQCIEFRFVYMRMGIDSRTVKVLSRIHVIDDSKRLREPLDLARGPKQRLDPP